jgi:hypothetical protein
VPLPAQSQQPYRPPVLTQAAADCALDLIEFMDTAVRGVDVINATERTHEIWRNYLAYYYPMLTPADQNGFANACSAVANVNAAWPQTPWLVREQYRQTWAMTLPPLLQFIEPVVLAAQQEAAQQNSAQFDDIAQDDPAPSAVQSLDPATKLQVMRDNAANLSRFGTAMTNSTIDLMHAMSGRR